ncbi:MAG: hypothetical protein M3O71_04875 [Bacteroidota bacterium]|nr:hypothetical protein [Bacteroidota bacterium]
MPKALLEEREVFGFMPARILISFSPVTMLFLIWGISNNMNDILIINFMWFVAPVKLMGIFGLINIVLVSAGILLTGFIGVWAIFFTSFFMSLMYPSNLALSIRILGVHTKIAGSIMVMAIVSGAFFPPLTGLIAAYNKSMALAMIILLISYAYITCYVFRGSGIRDEKFEQEPPVVQLKRSH